MDEERPRSLSQRVAKSYFNPTHLILTIHLQPDALARQLNASKMLSLDAAVNKNPKTGLFIWPNLHKIIIQMDFSTQLRGR